MQYHEVNRCDEFCPFYHKWFYRYGKEISEYERCVLLDCDYADPKQVLVRLWAKRRREVEDSYRHVRIIDRPDMDEVFPPVPDFCPIKHKPVMVRLENKDSRHWRGGSYICDHYGESPVRRTRKRLQEEEEQKRREREQRQIEKELKRKQIEERITRKQKSP